MDRRLATVLLLAAAVGVARASAHFIRLALVAVMGLAGMYMLHVLAQDYNAIRQPVKAKVASAILRSVIAKRSAADSTVVGEAEAVAAGAAGASAGRPSLDWGRVLRADPAGCARRVLCELAAKPEVRLGDADRRLLALVTNHSLDVCIVGQREVRARYLGPGRRRVPHAQISAASAAFPERCGSGGDKSVPATPRRPDRPAIRRGRAPASVSTVSGHRDR
ncbi:uncharacterized protein LOC126252409 [Schistocerca nitens]|uniref:uncharacterized protein LOC126252409 n=1 Tax=Schistocerca nitens TaxID=7011 RepID=UPI002117A44F|nr:uncharacterized protein LOC126252409 [Schistocerca nitens]